MRSWCHFTLFLALGGHRRAVYTAVVSTLGLQPTLYTHVAERILAMIEGGTLKPGDKLPSIRTLSGRFSVSVNTVKEAYALLETQRFLDARPQSGYYVRRLAPPLPQSLKLPNLDPREVTMCRIYGEVISRPHNAASLAIALPGSELLPAARLNKAFQGAWQNQGEDSLSYLVSPGLKTLREEIARHSLEGGLEVSPDQIIITSGASEAIYLAIQSLCRPGDTLAVETPTYFNFLHLLLELGIRVVEIPSDPQSGIQLEDLDAALTKHAVKGFLSIPNFNNPLGFSLSAAKKRQMVELLARHGVPLIEDDIYGELPFAGHRPLTCKSFDQTDRNILVSSFSKTLAPGYRVGWIIPGVWYDRVDRLKSLSTVGTATPNQMAIAHYLKTGGYARHLRSLRKHLARQTGALAETVADCFPSGTKVSRPSGGFVLWVELPSPFDTLKLYGQALSEGIAFSPGAVFSASGGFGNCLRLNAGTWNPAVEKAVRRLGELCPSK